MNTPKSSSRQPVTRKRQPKSTGAEADFTSAQLVAALEAAWAKIRARHMEIPMVVIVVGSGTMTHTAKHGHYAAMRWQHGSDRLPEVLISGEGLQRPAAEVLTTLLHEATHALADVRGIKDTSRQGRWHNQRFAALADELGLDASADPRIGWSPCALRDSTVATYRTTLNRLSRALSAYRHPEIHTGAVRRSNNALACACGCPRRIRVAKAVLELGAIRCDNCDCEFEAENE